MAEEQTKNPLTYVIPIIAVVVIIVAVAHYIMTKPMKPENVWREEMMCLSAGCFKDSLGVESCIEFKPQVAKVVVSPEYSPSDPLRLSIILLDKPCNTEG